MARFRYHRPGSLEELLRLLHDRGDGAKVLAGGQSLVPIISLGLAQPELLLDINRLPDLDALAFREGILRIGPLVRHATLEQPAPEVACAVPLLPLAARLIGHPAIRNRGTVLGSLVHADPAAEWPAVALALDAELVLRSTRGERTVMASEFFLGPLTTVLEADELLVEARLRAAAPGTGAAVLELTYRHGDYAVVGVATQLRLDDDRSTIREARLVLFGVGSTPLRAGEAERVLEGATPSAFGDAAEAAQRIAEPADDATASATYRRDMVGVFVRRALRQAYDRAREPVPGGPGEPAQRRR